MVKPNLPVGAVFEENGLHYEVQSVLPDGNYISKRVTEPKEQVVESQPEAAVEEIVPETKPEVPKEQTVRKRTTTRNTKRGGRK